MSGARLGQRSLERLSTCHPDLWRVVRLAEEWMPFDFTVLEGHRSKERQRLLFQQGRTLVGGKWTIADRSKVVTNVDGFERVGMHNHSPSLAVDLAPYPVSWAPAERWRFVYLAGAVQAAASSLNVPLRWGGDWDGDGDQKDHRFLDLPHFELT